jgi:hypothetical protein
MGGGEGEIGLGWGGQSKGLGQVGRWGRRRAGCVPADCVRARAPPTCAGPAGRLEKHGGPVCPSIELENLVNPYWSKPAVCTRGCHPHLPLRLDRRFEPLSCLAAAAELQHVAVAPGASHRPRGVLLHLVLQLAAAARHERPPGRGWRWHRWEGVRHGGRHGRRPGGSLAGAGRRRGTAGADAPAQALPEPQRGGGQLLLPNREAGPLRRPARSQLAALNKP